MTTDAKAGLSRPPHILAIESSCDDTGCAILSPEGRLLGQTLASQQDHAAMGGVVPEIAARAHLEILPALVRKCLRLSGVTLEDIGLFAATTGPGLIGGLIVGGSYARGLALAQKRPFMGVNHIEAHVLSALFEDMPTDFPPYLCLLMSGGHCECIAVEGIGRYLKLGGTIDDSIGECFDKVAKMLGLGWPGGPMVERLAAEGDPNAFALPHPLMNRQGCDFSFSGLKTAVARIIVPYGNAPLPRQLCADIAASFQSAIANILQAKLENALRQYPQASFVAVGGGVGANRTLRAALAGVARVHNLPLRCPPVSLCTDNAVMVGWAAFLRSRAASGLKKETDGFLEPFRPRWPLEEMGLPSL